MKVFRFASFAGMLLAISAVLPVQLHAQNRRQSLPTGATQCNLSIPIHIELVPVDGLLRVGQTARFEARIESDIDPALVRKMWVDYEVSEKLRAASGFSSRREIPVRKGRQLQEIGFVIPDRQRHQIRARLKVQLADGRIIARTAIRYVDLGQNPPDGMIGRLVDPDGTGIRVYQGQSAEK